MSLSAVKGERVSSPCSKEMGEILAGLGPEAIQASAAQLSVTFIALILSTDVIILEETPFGPN